MRIGRHRVVAVVLGVAMTNLGAVVADEDVPAGGPRLAPRDPIESAFALPPHVVLTPSQAEAYRAVRQQFEPLLRSALDRVQSATEEKDKTAAAREVYQIREHIQLAILNILRTVPPEVAAAAAKARKAAAEKAAHRKRHAPHPAHPKRRPPPKKPSGKNASSKAKR